MYNHPEFTTVESLYKRMEALPLPTVYGQLMGREDWGIAMARYVPAHMQTGFIVWIAFGKEDMLGGFMHSLLQNDLMRAFQRADNSNLAAMRDWVMFLHNYSPMGSYGSVENVAEWQGMLREED